jgi:hypothetical protein
MKFIDRHSGADARKTLQTPQVALHPSVWASGDQAAAMRKTETRNLTNQSILISAHRVRIDEHSEPWSPYDLERSPCTPHADLFDVRTVSSQACLQNAENHCVVFHDQYVARNILRGYTGVSQMMQVQGSAIAIAHNLRSVV